MADFPRCHDVIPCTSCSLMLLLPQSQLTALCHRKPVLCSNKPTGRETRVLLLNMQLLSLLLPHSFENANDPKQKVLTAVGKGVTVTKCWQSSSLLQPEGRPHIRGFANWRRCGANENLNQPGNLMIKSWKAEGHVSWLVLTFAVRDL